MNIKDDMTIERVRRLIASETDETHLQIQIFHDGTVALIDPTGIHPADASRDLYCRSTTFDAGNDYFGAAASQDDNHVIRILEALQRAHTAFLAGNPPDADDELWLT